MPIATTSLQPAGTEENQEKYQSVFRAGKMNPGPSNYWAGFLTKQS
jgi:hypothetical protein